MGHAKSPQDWGVDQLHHGIARHDKNTCKGMNNTPSQWNLQAWLRTLLFSMSKVGEAIGDPNKSMQTNTHLEKNYL